MDENICEIYALPIFVDMRGFTKWSSMITGSDGIRVVLQEFYTLIREHFTTAIFIKFLGDGAMVILEPPLPESLGDVESLLSSVLTMCKGVDLSFSRICEKFSLQYGEITPLCLGWGISRGTIYVLEKPEKDYVGMNVNIASRLCSKARPGGVIITREDFPSLGENSSLPYMLQERTILLEGISNAVLVWTSEQVVFSP
jgi:class 3 adenylate cyclase